jgi:hypothetical protein
MNQTVNSRSPWLVAGIIAAVLMIAFVAASRSFYFETSILELGDSAVNALQIDNAKHGTEIYGNYSRFGFNHPGPALFYLYAAGEIVLRDWLGLVPSSNNAHLLASLAVQIGCFALALALIHCWFDSWLLLAVALLAGLWHFSLTPGAFNSIWPPHVLLMPFLCFMVAASSFAAGRTRDLAVMVVLGGLLFHGHVAQPLFVGGLGGLATFLYLRREKQAGTWAGWRTWAAAHRGLTWFCFVWLGLMLLPLVIDVLRYGLQSNLATIIRRFLLNSSEHKSILQSLLYFLSFATYGTNQEDVFTRLNGASFRFFLAYLPTLLFWAVALAGPAIVAWSRRRMIPAPLRDFVGSAYVVWGATALLCVVWGLLQAGPMYQFNGFFYYGVYYFAGAVGLGVLIHLFCPGSPTTPVVVLCCLASIVAACGFPLIAGSNEDTGQVIRRGVMAALAKHPAPRPVLLVFEHYSWPEVIPVALELQRRGIPYYTSPSWDFMVGRQHDANLLGPSPETAATIWWITKPAPDGIKITKDLAIFTEPAPLDPHGSEINFAKQANGFRHLVTGLSVGNDEHAWTEQPQVSLVFKPLPTTTDVQLLLDAKVNPRPDGPTTQPADVFFNGVGIGSVAAAERQFHSLMVPQALWNSAPRAKLELRFPHATRVYSFSKPANITWAAWGLWSVSFATPLPPAAAATRSKASLTAELAPVGGRIDFTAHGNLADYRVNGLAEPSAGDTRTDGPRMNLLFHPIPTVKDVELQIVAYPFAPETPAGPQPCKLFFNDQLVFSAPFVGPGVARVSIPAEMWNRRPINTLSLVLPDVPPLANGQTGRGLAIRWLRTGPLEDQP